MRSAVFYKSRPEATTSWRPPAFDAVSKGVAEVTAGFDEVRDSADKLRATVEWSDRLQRSLEALNARCLSQLQCLEKEGPPQAYGNLSAWLQDTLCRTPTAAQGQLNSARKLEQLPPPPPPSGPAISVPSKPRSSARRWRSRRRPAWTPSRWRSR